MKEKLDKELLKKSLENIEVKNKDRIISFLGLYKKGEFVYPSVVARNCRIREIDAKDILSQLDNMFLERYEYICTCCGWSIKNPDKYNDSDDIYCENCDNIINKDNKHIFYQCL